MKRFFILTVLFFVHSASYSQADTLATRFEEYLKGDIVIFGNNILNRNAAKTNALTPYDERGKKAKLNDELEMDYIDIDKKKNTFSASSAQFIAPFKKPKIVFAGLYWAATYPFERGKLVRKGRPINVLDKNRNDVSQVLLKLPKKNKFETINGEIIFDGSKKEEYINTMPYVAFADITSLVDKLKTPEGDYAVANVMATRGAVEGGSAAGWAIVLVYEDPNAPMRRIEVKDGFLEFPKTKKPIVFTKFQAPDEDEITARISGAVLEADPSVGENKLAIKTTKAGIFLEADKRPLSNFFNSSITEDDDYKQGRVPQSSNTLGFDIFNSEIPNFENRIIEPNITEINAEITSTEDVFYLFLMALSIDSEENPEIPAKKEEQPAEAPKVEEAKNEMPATPEPPKEETTAPKSEEPIVKAPSNLRKATIQGAKKGYYTILAAFSTEENATRYVENNKKKGMNFGKIHYPEKNIYYAYYSHSENYNDALKKQIEIINIGKEKPEYSKLKPWIFSVEN